MMQNISLKIAILIIGVSMVKCVSVKDCFYRNECMQPNRGNIHLVNCEKDDFGIRYEKCEFRQSHWWGSGDLQTGTRHICCSHFDEGFVACDGDSYQGTCKSYEMSGEECVNLNDSIAKSVNVKEGDCVRLYQGKDCTGKSRPIHYEYDGFYNSFPPLHLEDSFTVNSIGKCNDIGMKCTKLNESVCTSDANCPNSHYKLHHEDCRFRIWSFEAEQSGHKLACCPSVDDGFIACSDTEWKGECKTYSMEGKQCINLDEFQGNLPSISSLKTLNACFRVYEDYGCEGVSTALYPGTPSHNNFPALGINDKIRSVGRCYDHDQCNSRWKRSIRDEKSKEIIQNLPLCQFAANQFTIGFLWDSPNLYTNTTNIPFNSSIRYYRRSGLNGRTEVVDANIYRKHLNTGSELSNEAQTRASEWGVLGDQADLIVASRLGGSGTDMRNVFPQNPRNMEAWQQTATEIANIVERLGSVRLTINLLYHNPTDLRPYEFVYRVMDTVTGELILINDFMNVPKAQTDIHVF